MAVRRTDRWSTLHPTSVTPGDDAAVCVAITRAHARTFTLASYLLPAGKRRAAFAVYAFCRVADDIVDVCLDPRCGARAAGEVGTPPAVRLARYREELEQALNGGARGPVMRELARAADLHAIPPGTFRELLSGIGRDLRPGAYRSWEELHEYCEGVASSVGEICTHVFGVPGDARRREAAVRHARILGVAMQLTNILRDVGEDARRGRCYLPTDELEAAGLGAEEIFEAARLRDRTLARDPRWRELMGFQVARARALYAAANPGITLLESDARRCALACSSGYEAILGAIEERGYDTLTGRARVSRLRRAAVLWNAWRVPDTLPHVAPGATGPATMTDAVGAVGDPAVAWPPTAPGTLAALGRTAR